jgi:iron-sulfur cluster assembly accessory protein
MTDTLVVHSKAKPTPVTLSPGAARRLLDLSAQEGRPVMLRVAVEGGGCSGFQYQFDLVQAAEPHDLKVERDGAAALVDEMSLELLKGSWKSWPVRSSACAIRTPNPAAAAGSASQFRG